MPLFTQTAVESCATKSALGNIFARSTTKGAEKPVLFSQAQFNTHEGINNVVNESIGESYTITGHKTTPLPQQMPPPKLHGSAEYHKFLLMFRGITMNICVELNQNDHQVSFSILV